MGVLPKRGPPKFELLNLLSWTQEIFKVSKHKGKINFTKFGDSKMGILLKRDRQNYKQLNRWS